MYFILSDTHLGLSTADFRAIELANYYRQQGYRIVWLGDVFDLWIDRDAPRRYPVLQPGDIYIPGNHDFEYRPPEFVEYCPKGCWLETGAERWYAVHGDVIDFPFLFALLKQGRIPILSRLKRWKGGEYRALYRAFSQLPSGWVRDLVQGQLKLAHFYYPFLLLLAAWLPTEEEENVSPLTPGPLYTLDPAMLLERLLAFYPQAHSAHGFIMGHLHRPVQATQRYRLQVLGAWCDDAPRIGAVLDGHGLRLVGVDA